MNKNEKDSTSLTVSEIYKTHVLGITNQSNRFSEDNGLESFKNNNILKFKQNLSKDEPALSKKSSLSFT